jgi:hypothetical protein
MEDMTMSKILTQYVRRPVGPLFHDYDARHKFVKAVMKEFHGKKAVTPVEKLVKSFINNQKIGVIMAIPGDDDKVYVTYAKWNEGSDVYDKEFMKAVALDRAERFAEKPEDFEPKVPFDIAEKLPVFMARARRYFKDAKFPRWTEAY